MTKLRDQEKNRLSQDTYISGQVRIIDHGPLYMTVENRRAGVCEPKRTATMAVRLLHEFEQIAVYAQDFRFPELLREKDDVLTQKMLWAVAQTGDGSIKPLAAVAGAFNERFFELFCEGGEHNNSDTLLLNNGGDLLCWTKEEDAVLRIGSRSAGSAPYDIILRGSSKWGIASSGLGGRAYTRGIAERVTVIAADSAVADAAATHLANQTYVEHEHVERVLVGNIDPFTDIPELEVVKKVGLLPRAVVQQALEQLVAKTDILVSDKRIYGVLAHIQGMFLAYPEESCFYQIAQKERK